MQDVWVLMTEEVKFIAVFSSPEMVETRIVNEVRYLDRVVIQKYDEETYEVYVYYTNKPMARCVLIKKTIDRIL